jgi:hypothetical protein
MRLTCMESNCQTGGASLAIFSYETGATAGSRAEGQGHARQLTSLYDPKARHIQDVKCMQEPNQKTGSGSPRRTLSFNCS